MKVNLPKATNDRPQAHWHTHTDTGRQIDRRPTGANGQGRQTDRHTDTQTHIHRQTHTHAHRHTRTQTQTYTDTHTHAHRYTHAFSDVPWDELDHSVILDSSDAHQRH